MKYVWLIKAREGVICDKTPEGPLWGLFYNILLDTVHFINVKVYFANILQAKPTMIKSRSEQANKGVEHMERPILLATTASDETFAGLTYHLDGELVPSLTVELLPEQKIYFEHHILLWMSTGLKIGIKGALKRMIAGMQIFVTEASGPGQIAFSRDAAGHVFAMHIKQGQEIHVREHQFLAASDNIDYTFERIKGVSNMLFGGTGFFIDKFHGARGEGILWLHGYGNVFEKMLAPGEQIDIEPGSWLFKDASVTMETKMTRLSTGFLAGMNLILNRFTGPGRVGIQSMYLHLPSGTDNASSGGGAGANIGGLLGGLLDS